MAYDTDIDAVVRLVAADDKVAVPCAWCVGQARPCARNGDLVAQCVCALKRRGDGQSRGVGPALHVQSVIPRLKRDGSSAAPLRRALRIVIVHHKHAVDIEVRPAKNTAAARKRISWMSKISSF